jgi:peptidoglycan/LPS O-acetylase OafA/YrhL
MTCFSRGLRISDKAIVPLMSNDSQIPPPGGKYHPALDGLRACAVGTVLLSHLKESWSIFGGEGVYVFFVLSGFLITGILLHEQRTRGKVSFTNFYARRALRLLPALIACLILTCILVAWVHPEHFPAIKRGVPASLFYYSNWIRAFSSDMQILGPLGHTWSLSVEEQFYLIWPLPLIWVYRRSPRWALIGTIALALGSLGCQLALTGRENSAIRIYNGLDTNLQLLLAGCIVAILRPKMPAKQLPHMIAGIVASLVLLCQIHPFSRKWIDAVFTTHLGLTVTAVAAATLIHVLASGVRIPVISPILENAFMRWIGRISYGIYLYHVLALFLLPPLPQAVQDMLAALHAGDLFRAVIVVAIAAVSFYVIERPFLRMKDRFQSAPKPRPVAADPGA